MAEEGQEIQTEVPVKTPPTEQSPVEAPEVVEPQALEQPEQSLEEDKEAKKERDFEKATYKYRDLYRETKAKLDALEKPATNTVVNPDAAQRSPEEQEALGLLESMIEKAVAPLKQNLEQSNEEKILTEFEKKPYVNVLGQEINQELESISKSLPLAERLELARAKAIANNLPTIQKVYQEIGAEKAYNNKELKVGQRGLGESRGTPPISTESVVDRVMRGDKVTNQEYFENRDAIQEAMKNQINQS